MTEVITILKDCERPTSKYTQDSTALHWLGVSFSIQWQIVSHQNCTLFDILMLHAPHAKGRQQHASKRSKYSKRLQTSSRSLTLYLDLSHPHQSRKFLTMSTNGHVILCYQLRVYGKCPYGDKCPFSHDLNAEAPFPTLPGAVKVCSITCRAASPVKALLDSLFNRHRRSLNGRTNPKTIDPMLPSNDPRTPSRTTVLARTTRTYPSSSIKGPSPNNRRSDIRQPKKHVQ